MKKIAFLLVSFCMVSLMAWAGKDKPIQVSDMPKAAQRFVKQHFPNRSVALAKVETDFMSKSYDVIFTNGDKLEFDKRGKWTHIDCEHSQVPVEIIPAAIRKYMEQHYPDTKVLEIELDDDGEYEVELSNGFEIEFDKRMRVKDIDR